MWRRHSQHHQRQPDGENWAQHGQPLSHPTDGSLCPNTPASWLQQEAHQRAAEAESPPPEPPRWGGLSLPHQTHLPWECISRERHSQPCQTSFIWKVFTHRLWVYCAWFDFFFLSSSYFLFPFQKIAWNEASVINIPTFCDGSIPTDRTCVLFLPLGRRKYPLWSRSFPRPPSNSSQTQSIHVRPSHYHWKLWSPFRMVAQVELADEKRLNLNACLKCP